MKDECDKSLRGAAGQLFVAGELCRRNFVATLTIGNCPNTDILCSDLGGTRFVHIQVKTFRPGVRKCSVGMRAEMPYGKNFFWVLAGIPETSSKDSVKYFIVPAKIMAEHVKATFDLWAKTLGKAGQQHDIENKIRTVAIPPRKCHDGWSISEYEDRWDLIEEKIK